jgi:FMN phosphatase YigB (HAD superfamily)
MINALIFDLDNCLAAAREVGEELYHPAFEAMRHANHYFEKILLDSGLRSAEVLVVGDNADSEIAVGARLGMPTVQTLRPGVPYAANATFHIRSLHELKALLSYGPVA